MRSEPVVTISGVATRACFWIAGFDRKANGCILTLSRFFQWDSSTDYGIWTPYFFLTLTWTI